MTAAITIKIPFVSPAGTPGVLQLLQDSPASRKAFFSIDMGCLGDIHPACASLTIADMRRLVDAMMDVIQAIERHERLIGP